MAGARVDRDEGQEAGLLALVEYLAVPLHCVLGVSRCGSRAAPTTTRSSPKGRLEREEALSRAPPRTRSVPRVAIRLSTPCDQPYLSEDLQVPQSILQCANHIHQHLGCCLDGRFVIGIEYERACPSIDGGLQRNRRSCGARGRMLIRWYFLNGNTIDCPRSGCSRVRVFGRPRVIHANRSDYNRGNVGKPAQVAVTEFPVHGWRTWSLRPDLQLLSVKRVGHELLWKVAQVLHGVRTFGLPVRNRVGEQAATRERDHRQSGQCEPRPYSACHESPSESESNFVDALCGHLFPRKPFALSVAEEILLMASCSVFNAVVSVCM